MSLASSMISWGAVENSTAKAVAPQSVDNASWISLVRRCASSLEKMTPWICANRDSVSTSGSSSIISSPQVAAKKARLSAQALGEISSVASDSLPPSKEDRCIAATCGSSVSSTATTARSPNCSAVSLIASSACLVEPDRTSAVTCLLIAGKLVLAFILVLACVEQLLKIVPRRELVFILDIIAAFFLLQGFERIVHSSPALGVLEQESRNDRLARQLRVPGKNGRQSLAGLGVRI